MGRYRFFYKDYLSLFEPVRCDVPYQRICLNEGVTNGASLFEQLFCYPLREQFYFKLTSNHPLVYHLMTYG